MVETIELAVDCCKQSVINVLFTVKKFIFLIRFSIIRYAVVDDIVFTLLPFTFTCDATQRATHQIIQTRAIIASP